MANWRGIMEWWNIGILEEDALWRDALCRVRPRRSVALQMPVFLFPNIPKFQYSIIPVEVTIRST
jgi:hypothetical protein